MNQALGQMAHPNGSCTSTGGAYEYEVREGDMLGVLCMRPWRILTPTLVRARLQATALRRSGLGLDTDGGMVEMHARLFSVEQEPGRLAMCTMQAVWAEHAVAHNAVIRNAFKSLGYTTVDNRKMAWEAWEALWRLAYKYEALRDIHRQRTGYRGAASTPNTNPNPNHNREQNSW